MSDKKMYLSLLSWCERNLKNLKIKAVIHKTEGLVKWPILYLRQIKYFHITCEAYVSDSI